MLVSELAERADVPLATVKYYLREGLLPVGENTGPRRAEYDERHLRRLRVLRLLREVGEVPVTSLRQIVDRALELLVRTESRKGILAYYGSGIWTGDLQASRKNRA